MPPQLNFLGKKLFMEHMLKDHKYKRSKCFLRSLLINKRFLSISINQRIYKVYIPPNSADWIRIYFESYTGGSSRYYGVFTTEVVCCMLKLLKPFFAEFEYDFISYQERSTVDDLLTLIQLASANGKVSLRIYKNKTEDEFFKVLKDVYKYVDELICSNNLLMRAYEFKFKLLDKLEVSDIESSLQLNAVLKHPAKRLFLGFSLHYFDGDESVHFHKNDAKQCKLNFGEKDVGQSYPIIQNVINACEKLETLDLIYYNRLDHDLTDFATFLNEISHLYQMFTSLIEMIRQFYSNPKLNITFNSDQEWFEIKIKLPEDWQKQIKQIGGLQNAEIEDTKDEYNTAGKKVSVQIKDELTNAKFCFSIWCDPE